MFGFLSYDNGQDRRKKYGHDISNVFRLFLSVSHKNEWRDFLSLICLIFFEGQTIKIRIYKELFALQKIHKLISDRFTSFITYFATD